jgi:hypothetical protein|tara:strand:+ start:1021 stop:1149 length:129 start_codon:yes stop_codon:yes gene_type:complete
VTATIKESKELPLLLLGFFHYSNSNNQIIKTSELIPAVGKLI